MNNSAMPSSPSPQPVDPSYRPDYLTPPPFTSVVKAPRPQPAPSRHLLPIVIFSLLSLIAIVSAFFAILNFTEANRYRSDHHKLTAEINKLRPIVKQLETVSGSSINSPSDLPDLALSKEYLYLPFWQVKLKLPSDLIDFSYIFRSGTEDLVCFTGHPRGVSLKLAFADLTKYPGGSGCVLRREKSAGLKDNQGINFGQLIKTIGEYNYFYRAPAKFLSTQPAERDLERSVINSIKQLVTTSLENY